MAVTYVVVEGVLATTGTSLLYTAPSTVLMSIVRWGAFVNTDTGTARQAYLYKIPTAGSTNSASMIRVGASGNTIAAGKTETWDTLIFVAPSGRLYHQSDAANAIATHMSIIEVS